MNIEPVLKYVGYSKRGRNYSIPHHQHFDYELIYLINGTYEYLHNNTRNELETGAGFLIRPGDWHTDFLAENTEYITVNFVFRNDSLNVLRDVADERLLRFRDQDGLIKNILLKLLTENSSARPFSSLLQETYVLELYWQVLRLLPREAIPDALLEDEEKLRFQNKLHKVFLQHIHKFPSLELLAAQMYLSPRTLNNYCRNILGMSPVKAFMKAKMDYSLELVTCTAMSIKEISEYLGFQNPYHFSKVFRRFFNYSPTFVRTKHKSR